MQIQRHKIIFFKITNAINGTITTLSAVRNAFFEGVVYCNPIIWKANPIKSVTPIKTPAFIAPARSFNFSSLFRCPLLITPISTDASKNLTIII